MLTQYNEFQMTALQQGALGHAVEDLLSIKASVASRGEEVRHAYAELLDQFFTALQEQENLNFKPNLETIRKFTEKNAELQLGTKAWDIYLKFDSWAIKIGEKLSVRTVAPITSPVQIESTESNEKDFYYAPYLEGLEFPKTVEKMLLAKAK